MKKRFVNMVNFVFVNKSVLFAIILISTSKMVFSQELRVLRHEAYQRGEVLGYKASYGIIDAARATLSVMPNPVMIGQRRTYHVVGTGESLGALKWLFKVEDRYESFIDDKALVPLQFFRRVKEGGFRMKRNIYFNQNQHIAQVKNLKDDTEKSFKTKPNTQDLLSSFYFARTLNLQEAQVGDEFSIPTFFDHENYPMKIKFLGKEVVKTSLGRFNCLKFVPLLQEGRVFKEKESMTIWLSDDKNKVPIRLKTDLLVGSIKLDLDSYSGLMSPLVKIQKHKK